MELIYNCIIVLYKASHGFGAEKEERKEERGEIGNNYGVIIAAILSD